MADRHFLAERMSRPGGSYTAPDDPDWSYVTIEGVRLVACGRCGAAIAKLGPHMSWHRWLDRRLGQDTPPAERSGSDG